MLGRAWLDNTKERGGDGLIQGTGLREVGVEERFSSLPGEARGPGSLSREPRLTEDAGWRLGWLWSIGLCSLTWYHWGVVP